MRSSVLVCGTEDFSADRLLLMNQSDSAVGGAYRETTEWWLQREAAFWKIKDSDNRKWLNIGRDNQPDRLPVDPSSILSSPWSLETVGLWPTCALHDFLKQALLSHVVG